MTTTTAPPPSKFGICTRCGARKAITNLQEGLCRGKYSNSPDSCVAAVAREKAAAAQAAEVTEHIKAIGKRIIRSYPNYPMVRTIGTTTLYSDIDDPKGPRIILAQDGTLSLRLSKVSVDKAMLMLLLVDPDFYMKDTVRDSLEVIIEHGQLDSDDATVIEQMVKGDLCSAEIIKTMEAVGDRDNDQVEAAIELARALNTTYPNLQDVFKDASQKDPALRGLYFQVSKLCGLAKAVDS
jgi:hypothetical protein